jgi:hypothetical protein
MSKAPSIYTILASAGGLCRDTGHTRTTSGQLRAATRERARHEGPHSDKRTCQGAGWPQRSADSKMLDKGAHLLKTSLNAVKCQLWRDQPLLIQAVTNCMTDWSATLGVPGGPRSPPQQAWVRASPSRWRTGLFCGRWAGSGTRAWCHDRCHGG